VVADPPALEPRELAGRDAEAIFRAVSEHYGLDRSALAQRGDSHIARAVDAWLCRRHSEVPLRELAPGLGLSPDDSVPNLTRRMNTGLRAHPKLADELQQITARVESVTKNQAWHPDCLGFNRNLVGILLGQC